MALKRNSKRAAACAALFVLILWAIMPGYFHTAPAALAKMRTDQLSIEKSGGGAPAQFTIERAETDQEKALGLMFRTELKDSEGMLFNYGRSFEVTMWMRNTYIPLDMVFIRADGIIHRIEVRGTAFGARDFFRRRRIGGARNCRRSVRAAGHHGRRQGASHDLRKRPGTLTPPLNAGVRLILHERSPDYL